MNLMDVTKNLQTEDQCLDRLELRRWPDGIRCPQCGGAKLSRITRTVDPTKTRSEKKQNKRTRLYACLESTCNYRFTPTVGTLFQDSHLPLTKWFAAIALIVDAKKGMSAKQMQRHLGVSYKAAWYMGHRIRKSMAQGSGITVTPLEVSPRPKLAGIVEMDETYVGGKQKGKGVYYGKKQKAVVIGLRERGGELRFVHTSDAKSETIKTVMEQNVSPDVGQIMTDESSVTMWLLRGNPKHHMIRHKDGHYVEGTIHTNSIESAFSLLKRGIIGSFHRISHKHLHRYLSEFEYRFNGRKDADLFGATLARMLDTKEMKYSELTAN
jgi:transposase-like protein